MPFSCTQAKMVRLGFEELREAQEWYALLAIVMGLLDLEDPALQQLPKALSMSQKLRSLKASASCHSQ